MVSGSLRQWKGYPPPPSEPAVTCSLWASIWDRIPFEQLGHKALADAIGDLPAVLQADGISIQYEKFCCPFHKDTRPSASLYQHADGCVRFKCFGCDAGGSVFDYVMLRDGGDFIAAREWVIDQAVANVIEGRPALVRYVSQRKKRTMPPPFPTLTPGTDRDRRALAELRSVSLEAVKLAVDSGLLGFGTTEDLYGIGDDCRFWGVGDSTRQNLQLRKLSGGPWQVIGQKKARTWTGCRASWPIGLAQAGSKILLVEGGPDLLAALHFTQQFGEDSWSPVAILGAGQNLQKEDLRYFVGKRVRIVPHLDLDKNRVGWKAAKKWAGQLLGSARRVDAFDLEGLRKIDGTTVDDLNDCTKIHPADVGKLSGLLV